MVPASMPQREKANPHAAWQKGCYHNPGHYTDRTSPYDSEGHCTSYPVFSHHGKDANFFDMCFQKLLQNSIPESTSPTCN